MVELCPEEDKEIVKSYIMRNKNAREIMRHLFENYDESGFYKKMLDASLCLMGLALEKNGLLSSPEPHTFSEMLYPLVAPVVFNETAELLHRLIMPSEETPIHVTGMLKKPPCSVTE